MVVPHFSSGHFRLNQQSLDDLANEEPARHEVCKMVGRLIKK
jgi:hypothetical protein